MAVASSVLHVRPLRVLADRSRDRCSGYGLVRLQPVARFAVTDRLAGSPEVTLDGYDVVSIIGQSAAAPGAGELRRLEAFVKRGGTLILAASAGVFEASTGLPVDRMHAHRVASRFGFGFRTAKDLPLNSDGYRGYRREEVSLTDAGAASGLAIGDVWLEHTSGIDAPRGATILLRAGGTPVMAWIRHGRGKVLVSGDPQMFSEHHAFVLSQFLMLVEPEGRATLAPAKAAALPKVIAAPYRQKKGRHVTISHTAAGAGRAARALRLADEAVSILLKIVEPARKVRAIDVYLESGCTGWTEWHAPDDAYEVHLGMEANDAAFVRKLVGAIGFLMASRRIGWEVRSLLWPAQRYLQARVLGEMGFVEEAAGVEAAVEAAPRMPGVERVDLGRHYSEFESPPEALRFWFGVAREFGDDALARFCKGHPKKDAFKHVDLALWSELDVIAHGLARIYGPRVYAWMRSRGWTVREMPLEELSGSKFCKALPAALEKIVRDAAEPASVRFDAIEALARALKPEKEPLDACAKAAAGKSLPALAAAARVAAAKDARGAALLAPWLRQKDPAMAAIAALLAMFHCPDKTAADLLVALAPHQDTRFKLSAGYALALTGDPRAKQFAFHALPGCRMHLEHDGFVKAFPFVDGYPVANVFNLPTYKPAMRGTAFSQFYVQWVHTSPRWRRRGLARLGLAAALDSHWDRDCAITALHTGTSNVAHALYRDFGLVDYWRNVGFEKKLDPATDLGLAPPPKGVRVRRARAEEYQRIAAFLCDDWLRRPIDRPHVQGLLPDHVAFVAEARQTLAGVLLARVRGEKAEIEALSIVPPKDRKSEEIKEGHELVGLALLTHLHRALRPMKVKKVELGFWNPWGDKGLYWLMHRAGYGSFGRGGVELFRMNNLAAYLGQTRDALAWRLSQHKTWKHWTGSLELEASGRGARLEIDHGKVSVGSLRSEVTAPERATIRIAGPLPALQRFVQGIRSCFEECLQIEVQAQPLVNGEVKDLLETLFPRVVAESTAG